MRGSLAIRMLAAAVLAVHLLAPLQAWAAAGDIESDAPAVPTDSIGLDVEVAAPEVAAPNDTVVYRDLERLPAPVARTRERLMAAARSGDIEALRPIIEDQAMVPNVSFGGADDPVEFLRTTSADGEGREPLGIMLELLEAPFAVLGEGTDREIYVWPYLAAVRLDALSPAELVELYKLVPHHDYQDMLAFGGWYFFRVGIMGNGDWAYFVAGD